MRLEDRVAVITGAGSGLGRAGALAFAREGARVVASDLDPASTDATVAAIRAAGDERADLRDDAFAKDHAMGLQPPEEIAGLAVFLASDEASNLTGAVLACDRGWTAFKRPAPIAG